MAQLTSDQSVLGKIETHQLVNLAGRRETGEISERLRERLRARMIEAGGPATEIAPRLCTRDTLSLLNSPNLWRRLMVELVRRYASRRCCLYSVAPHGHPKHRSHAHRAAARDPCTASPATGAGTVTSATRPAHP
jgi:hypothetical protein